MITIKEMKTKQELTQFVKFPFSLYDKSSNWVPPLINDELESMDPEKNPVFKNAEARFFLAFKGKKPVGRIAAIINHIEITVYADLDPNCNSLDFQLGSTGIAATIPTRSWNIKVG